MFETPEGRAQMAEWRSRIKNRGRPAGSTNGYTRHQRNKLIAKASAEAKLMVDYMEKKGMVTFKDDIGREALEFAIGIVRRPDVPIKDQLTASRTVLDFTMAKPASETTVNVKKAEDFLTDLAAEMKLDK